MDLHYDPLDSDSDHEEPDKFSPEDEKLIFGRHLHRKRLCRLLLQDMDHLLFSLTMDNNQERISERLRTIFVRKRVDQTATLIAFVAIDTILPEELKALALKSIYCVENKCQVLDVVYALQRVVRAGDIDGVEILVNSFEEFRKVRKCKNEILVETDYMGWKPIKWATELADSTMVDCIKELSKTKSKLTGRMMLANQNEGELKIDTEMIESVEESLYSKAQFREILCFVGKFFPPDPLVDEFSSLPLEERYHNLLRLLDDGYIAKAIEFVEKEAVNDTGIAMGHMAKLRNTPDRMLEFCSKLGSYTAVGNLMIKALKARNFTLVETLLSRDDWIFQLRDYQLHFPAPNIHDRNSNVALSTGPSGVAVPLAELIRHYPKGCLAVLDRCILRRKIDQGDEPEAVLLNTELLENSFIEFKDKGSITSEQASVTPLMECFRPEKNPLKTQLADYRQQILEHPVTKLYIHHKWAKYSTPSWIGNILYLLFFISYLGFVFSSINRPPIIQALGLSCTLNDSIKDTSAGDSSDTSCKCFYSSRLPRNVVDNTMYMDLTNSIFLGCAWFFIWVQIIIQLLGWVINIKVCRQLWNSFKRNKLLFLRKVLSLYQINILLDIPLIVLSYISMIDFCSKILDITWLVLWLKSDIFVPEFWQRNIAAIAIILCSIKFLLMIRRLPFKLCEEITEAIDIVKNMHIIKGILSLVLFIVVVFSLVGFLILMDDTPSFSNFPKSVVMCLLFLVGQFNFKELFSDRSLASHVIIACLVVLFILLVILIMLNIMVGIIVNEMGRIREKARTNGTYLKLRFIIDDQRKLRFISAVFKCLRFPSSWSKKLDLHLADYSREVVIKYSQLPKSLRGVFSMISSPDYRHDSFDKCPVCGQKNSPPPPRPPPAEDNKIVQTITPSPRSPVVSFADSDRPQSPRSPRSSRGETPTGLTSPTRTGFKLNIPPPPK